MEVSCCVEHVMEVSCCVEHVMEVSCCVNCVCAGHGGQLLCCVCTKNSSTKTYQQIKGKHLTGKANCMSQLQVLQLTYVLYLHEFSDMLGFASLCTCMGFEINNVGFCTCMGFGFCHLHVPRQTTPTP